MGTPARLEDGSGRMDPALREELLAQVRDGPVRLFMEEIQRGEAEGLDPNERLKRALRLLENDKVFRNQLGVGIQDLQRQQEDAGDAAELP